MSDRVRKSERRIAVALCAAAAGLIALALAAGVFAASNENLGDRAPDAVDKLIKAGPEPYCENVAEFWDDGTWAASMGIANIIFGRDPNYAVPANPDDLPRDGIHHGAWNQMTEHEQTWYAFLFHAGWLAGRAFMKAHPDVLIVDPHDFSGHIPIGFRMELKQGRFEQCLREWPPRET
jgi:hypothetical protein